MYSELLKELYERISELRRQRVRMKDIAIHINMQSSVVSALYSSVLPIFLANVDSMGETAALDYAVSQVNNVSKKRILSSLPEICRRLKTFVPEHIYPSKGFFIDSLGRFAIKGGVEADDYLGVYDTYSLSSARDALKVEPIILSRGDAGEIMAVRKSVYNTINKGVAILSNAHGMYLMLNELDGSKLAMVSMFIQLPFYEKARFFRGLYLALDYNRNPIARRILLVKRDASFVVDNPDELEGKLIAPEDLEGDMVYYYNYVSDIIKICSIPFPKFNSDDLISEKEILSITKK